MAKGQGIKEKIDLEISKPIKEGSIFRLKCKVSVSNDKGELADGQNIFIYDDSLDEKEEVTEEGYTAHTFEFNEKMAGEKINITARAVINGKEIKKSVSRVLPKEEDKKEKKPEIKDFSKVLTAVASIRSQDISMKTTKKIEEWMQEMGPEREIVFASLCKLPQERIEPIIKQIIFKQSHYSRREIAESFGLYSMEVNTERYSKIILGAETQDASSVLNMERWFNTLTPCQTNYFKSSLSGMKTKEGIERYIYLSQLTTDTEKIKKSTILNLLFM